MRGGPRGRPPPHPGLHLHPAGARGPHPRPVKAHVVHAVPGRGQALQRLLEPRASTLVATANIHHLRKGPRGGPSHPRPAFPYRFTASPFSLSRMTSGRGLPSRHRSGRPQPLQDLEGDVEEVFPGSEDLPPLLLQDGQGEGRSGVELRPEGASPHQEPPLQEGHLHLPLHLLQEPQEGPAGRATGEASLPHPGLHLHPAGARGPHPRPVKAHVVRAVPGRGQALQRLLEPRGLYLGPLCREHPPPPKGDRGVGPPTPRPAFPYRFTVSPLALSRTTSGRGFPWATASGSLASRSRTGRGM